MNIWDICSECSERKKKKENNLFDKYETTNKTKTKNQTVESS